VGFYHRERNHHGLGNELIEHPPAEGRVGRVRRHQRLGGLLNYYTRAAWTPGSVQRWRGTVRVWQPINVAKAPQEVQRLLAACLARDPPRRLRDIADAERLLDPSPPAVMARAPSARLWAAATMIVVLSVVGAALWQRARSAIPRQQPIVLSIAPPSSVRLAPVGGQTSTPELAPDGSAVAFVGLRRGIFVRSLDSLTPQLVPGSQDVRSGPFWSPDSTTIAWPDSVSLLRVRLPNGVPQVIAPLRLPVRGASWSERGTILVSMIGLHAVSATGGTFAPVPISGLEDGAIWYPEFLPGGEDFLFEFVPFQKAEDAGVYLATLRGGRADSVALLVKNGTAARYTPSGDRLLYVQNDRLYSQKLNRTTRRLEGEAELVVDGVASQPAMTVHRADFSVARDGTIAWRPGTAALTQVTTFDRHGKILGTSGPPQSAESIVLSADETRLLAFAQEGAWLLEVDQPGRIALPRGPLWFAWSYDGLKILGHGDRTIVETPADGSGTQRIVGPYPSRIGLPYDVSPDGMSMVTMAAGGGPMFTVRQELAAPRGSRSGLAISARCNRASLRTDAGSCMPREKICRAPPVCSSSHFLDPDRGGRSRLSDRIRHGERMAGRSCTSVPTGCVRSPSRPQATTSALARRNRSSPGFGSPLAQS
jgi:hypothetical protein